MNIEEGIIKAKAILDNHREIDKMMVIEMVELIETLLTAYEKEKEIIKNAICFLKYYNKDFNKMSDNEIKQILYSFGKCADIKKEE